MAKPVAGLCPWWNGAGGPKKSFSDGDLVALAFWVAPNRPGDQTPISPKSIDKNSTDNS
jgi:hypothetical protein